MEKTVASCVKGEVGINRFIIPYRVYGRGKECLVCVNGIQQSMAMWHSFVRRFSDRFKIVIFNFPNQGKNQIVSGSAYIDLDEQVEILYAVLAQAVPDRAVTICSASWGGVIAASFATRFPSRVKRMVLASLGSKPNKKMVEIIQRAAEIPDENRSEMAKVLIESFGQTLPESIKSQITLQFQRMDQESLKSFTQHGLFIISSKELDEAVDLGKIRCKTVLLNGEDDTLIDLDDVKRLASQIPGSELKIVKGVGHFLHMEKSELMDVYAEILDSY